jgi:hypothetical protein
MPDLTVSSAVDTLMQASDQADLRSALALGNSATLNTGTTAGTVATGDHTHDASAITAGTLDAARLPTPGTTTLGGVKRNAGSAGQFVNGINSSGDLTYATPSGGSSSATHVILGSDVTITDNATLQNITGLSFSVSANTNYSFYVIGVIVTSAGGTGYEFGITGPSSPTFWATEARAFNATAGANTPGMLNSVSGAYGSIASAANGSVVGTQVVGSGVFQNGSNAGTLQFTAKVETAVSGSITFKAGSRIIYWQTA